MVSVARCLLVGMLFPSLVAAGQIGRAMPRNLPTAMDIRQLSVRAERNDTYAQFLLGVWNDNAGDYAITAR